MKAERIRTLFHEQGISIVSIFTAFESKKTLPLLGHPHKQRGFKKWLSKLVDAPKRLSEKAVEALSAIVEKVVAAISIFLGKAVGFVAEDSWTLIAFVAGLIWVCLMKKVKKYHITFSMNP